MIRSRPAAHGSCRTGAAACAWSAAGLRHCGHLISRFRGDRAGVSAVIYALLALPIITAVALAIDLAGAMTAKSKLDVAADAAVLTATITASEIFATNPVAPLDPAETAGGRRFQAQVGSLEGVSVQPPQVKVTRDGATFTASLAYDATYSTFLGSVVGVLQIPFGGLAQAQITTGPYVDVQVLMDNSSSMLIAATPTDITNMLKYSIKNDSGQNYANPAASWWPSGCSFACHWDPNNNDFYYASRMHNVTLRLDQLKTAVTSVATTINAKNLQSQYRFGLYTFSTDVTTVYPLSGNVAAALSSITGVSPPLADPNAAYQTNVTQSIYNFAAKYLTQAGDGSTATSPKKFVFILTDGVQDVYKAGASSNRVESAMDPASCAAIKAKGATVAVLHTIYYNPNNEYAEISAIQGSVAQALQQCASGAGLYFAVSDQAGINAAIQAMLNVAIATPSRLTF